MPNDVFVDNNVAKNFCNPADPHYKDFIKWLFEEGHLAVSNKILGEYVSSVGGSQSATNIVASISRLTRDGRLIKFSQEQLTQLVFSKRIIRKLRSNRKDHAHIRVVLLSCRKLALSLDANFRYDVNSFPGHQAVARARPEELSYR
jgi:hypothetical protein